MKVLKILSDIGFSNSYLISNGCNGFLIDCAEQSVYDICKNLNIKIEAVLLTHGHFDHVGGCKKFYDNGVEIICGEKEKNHIFSSQYLGIFGGVTVPHFKIAKTVSDGDTLHLSGLRVKVLETSGHSEGSVCYLIDNFLFSGDTLFCGNIGRCDLPTGNYSKLLNSLSKLGSLDGNFKIYCGHGEDTTLDCERKFNGYMRNL